MTIKEILEAIAGAMVFLWGLWTELRLRDAQSANEVMRRSLNDEKIKAAVSAMPDSDLKSELSKDVS